MTSQDQLFSSDEAADAARRWYGLAVEATPLAAEFAQNFQLETAAGQRYILKIVPQRVSADDLDWEHRALHHLAESGLEVRTPRVLPARDGREVVTLESGQRLRLLSYVPGYLWAEAENRSPRLLESLGTQLAEVDRALERFVPPTATRVHDWDLAGAERHRGAVEILETAQQRRWVEEIFQLYCAEVLPLRDQLPRSVIHGDANDYNLLISGDGSRVSGLLDFGDLVESFTVGDLAIAAAYALLGEERPLAALEQVVRAYQDRRPLIWQEQRVLYPLMLTRLAVSVLEAARRRQTRPDNPYLFVSEAPIWKSLDQWMRVDPAAALQAVERACGVATEEPSPSPEDLLAARARRLGSNLSVSYRQPLKIVRGRGQYLFDHRGRPYLDLANNVCHVGHCHPRVVEAASRQMAILNTNSRYLYDGLTAYADRLCATLPEPLSVCFLVCSGSEANELALRLARAHTGRKGIVVLAGAYHGHTTSLIDISPYKFLAAGGAGKPEPWVHVAPVADGYRGARRGQGREVGEFYGDRVGEILTAAGGTIGAFIAESLQACGGQIVPPEGYLATVFRHVRAAGGVCIADEVQVGFGRVGTHFWGFEQQAVVPDIVVLGKPIGNGHPMAAVITTPAIAASFANGMEFFSTFGGNPVSCAVGMAVLDVVEEEGLQEHALQVGQVLLDGFRALQERYELIGDVRGTGLFVGVEMVRDRQTLEPAAEEADEVVERLKGRGILLTTDGPLHNVLKIKPPMVLTQADAEMVVRSLDDVLAELGNPAATRKPSE